MTQTTQRDGSIPGSKLLLLGGTGTGKTHAIRSWIKAGVTPFCIFTEPSHEVLGDIPADKLHWHYIPAMKVSFGDMLDSAKKINQSTYEMLAKMPSINKEKYTEMIDVLTTCNAYRCDRTGESFGAVDSWNTDRVLVLDSLSGLSIMAMNLVVGSKPVKAQGEWGVAMDNLERFIYKLTTDLQCHFMLTAHAEREIDEVAGGTNVTVSTLGRKLAPKLPRFFSDVVLAKRDGADFTWSTAATGVDLKTRNLKTANDITPSAEQIIDTWKSRGGVILPTTPVVAAVPSAGR